MALASLVVALGLDAAHFTSGLTKAEYDAKKLGQAMSGAVASGVLKAQLAVEAMGLSVSLVADTFRSIVNGAAAFQDLAETTGASAEDLASFAVAAATAGVQVDSVGASLNRLTKNLVGVDDESAAAGAALAALGINVAAFKALDPAAQYEAVGKALGGFADGAVKSAVAMALFGKSGAEQLKVFKALEEQGGRHVILTQRQIELADAFADRQAKQAAEIRQYAQAIVAETLPALGDLTRIAAEAAKSMLGLDSATKGFSADNTVRKWAEEQAIAIAELVGKFTSLIMLLRAVGGSFQSVAADVSFGLEAIRTSPRDIGKAITEGNGPLAKALEERNRIARDANQRYVDYFNFDEAKFAKGLRSNQDERNLIGARLGATTDPRSALFGKKIADPRPELAFAGKARAGGAGGGDDLLKKQLDGEVKAIRAWADEQRDAFAFANTFLQAEGAERIRSLQSTFAAEATVREGATQAAIAAQEREIAALQAYRTKATGKDRVEAENRIADAVAKRAAIVTRAGYEGILASQREAAAVGQARRAYEDLQVSVLDLQGKTAKAAEIRIQRQVADATKTITASGGDPELGKQYEAGLLGAEKLRQAQAAYNGTVDKARMAEETLILDAQARGATELEVLRSVGAARAITLVQLAELRAQAEALAQSMGSPEAVKFAENLALAFKRASAEVDPLLLKINDLAKEVGNSIASGFESAIVSGKGLREILKGIAADLLRITTSKLITEPLADAITGGLRGGSGGSGGIFGKALGFLLGGGGGGGVQGLPSGEAADLFWGGPMAGGGPVAAGGMYRVAENRPEMLRVNGEQFLLMGNQRGNIDPNPGARQRSQRATSTTINISMPAGATGQTANQVANAVASKLRKGALRNG